MRYYFRAITTILFGGAVCLFWGLGYPEALNYQEQNQLWLTTGDYFRERITVPGGLADYVSEFLVQFYYVPWLGALLIGIVYAAMQWLMWTTVRRWDRTAFTAVPISPVSTTKVTSLSLSSFRSVIRESMISTTSTLLTVLTLRRQKWISISVRLVNALSRARERR